MATATIQSAPRSDNATLGAEQAVFTTSSSVHAAIFFVAVGCLIGYRVGSVSGWTLRGVVSLGAYLIAAPLCVRWLRASRLSCYDKGLVNHAITGSTTVPWDDVESIRLSVLQRRMGVGYTATSHLITLTTGDGGRLKLGDRFDDPFAIWTYLITATGAGLLARAERDFAASNTVDFGFATLGRETGLVLMPLCQSPVTIPLENLTDYDVKGGDVRFWRKGLARQIAIPIDCVPNVFVLLNMLDARTSNARATLLTLPEVFV